MSSTPTKSTPSELDQAAADRRSFGNSALAANAEFKVIAEALREIVIELRLIRRGFDQLVQPGSREPAATAAKPALAPAAVPAARV